MTKERKTVGFETDRNESTKKDLTIRYKKHEKGELLSIRNDAGHMFSVNMADIRRLIAE